MPSVKEWIALVGSWYDTYGYILVFVGALAENTALLGLFLPGGTLAALGAFYARVGTLNLVWVIVLAWLGTVLGYHVDYLLGRFALSRLLGHWGTTPLGRRLRLAGRVRLARAFLAKHGGKAILLSHTAGHLRSFVALSAGATHMAYARFLAFELVAALIWNSAFCAVGYLVGAELNRLLAIFERIGWISLVLLGAGLVLWYVARRRTLAKRRAHARLSRRHIRPFPSEGG
jgi:membrane protein DedA with SNARE-associated domain